MIFRLRTLFYLQLSVALLTGLMYWWPKSEALSCCDEYTGWYRGIGLFGQTGFLGRSYFMIELPPTGRSHGNTLVYLTGAKGYNRFQGNYHNGTLREEGTCYVGYSFFGEPMPHVTQVLNGVYYKPDGVIGARVVDGTGHQVYWNPGGRVIWDLELKDGQRVAVHVHEE